MAAARRSHRVLSYDRLVATDVIPDQSTAYGARVHRRLTEEQVIWLTTVGRDGTPQPNPVWFLWEGEDSILTYNRSDANRLAHIRRQPRVSLNLDGNGRGGDIVVLTGTAEILEGDAPVVDNTRYLDKYREGIERVSGSVEAFAETYSVAVRIRLTRVRGL